MAKQRRERTSTKSEKETSSLDKLLYHELQDIYDAERQLTKALPDVASAACSEELADAIREHLEVTKNQVTRLEDVFEALGKAAKGKTCAGMKGLIEEGRKAIEEAKEESDAFGDLAIIAGAQRIEHYEISAYGTAKAVALALGNEDAADLLEETLAEEKEADETLTQIAQDILHAEAEQSERSDDGARKAPGRLNEMPEEAETDGQTIQTRRKTGLRR